MSNPDKMKETIAKDLAILFIGYNPSLRSIEIGHHYAGRNNNFWRALADAGLTSERLTPERDEELLSLGFGCINIVQRPTRQASEITAAEYREGAKRLRSLLEYYKPLIACYVGIGVFKAFTRRRKVDYGLQEESSVEGVLDYVAPSTSGLNRMLYPEQVEHYRRLRLLLDELRQQQVLQH